MSVGAERSDAAVRPDRLASLPTPPVVVPAEGAALAPRRPRLFRLRADIRELLARARALESTAPEIYGFNLDTASWLYLITTSFYRWYFRTEVYGIEHLPPGPVMLVANHGSHVLSWDGANILSACLLEADPPRLVHGMGGHRLMELPVLGSVARRIGAVDGGRPACTRILEDGGVVLTFPEGIKALARPFRERYQLLPFGSGFVHVAIATGVPIVPVAVVGAEEEAPMLANPEWIQRLTRTPVAPITPTLVVPLPVRYRLHFGAPMHARGPATPERVAEGVAEVRDALMALLARGLRTRRSVFF